MFLLFQTIREAGYSEALEGSFVAKRKAKSSDEKMENKSPGISGYRSYLQVRLEAYFNF